MFIGGRRASAIIVLVLAAMMEITARQPADAVSRALARPVQHHLRHIAGSSGWTSPGYWLATSGGGVYSEGSAPFYGSAGGNRLDRPVVGLAPTPDGRGYWLVASDGGVFAYGDAAFAGSTGSLSLRAPVVAMAPTPDGHGYWLAGADGGLFAFGDAPFLGSAAARRLTSPVVALAATPSGLGYWMATAAGQVLAFGDAEWRGSLPAAPRRRPAPPVRDLVPTPSGHGYWLVTAKGRVVSFGDAPDHGSASGLALGGAVASMAATADAGGYWLAGADGGVLTYGNARYGGRAPAGPVVAVAAVPARARARVAAFYYPWYGSPDGDGAWRHWDQGGHSPGDDIGSDFYPERGPYSSSDPAVVAAQMSELARAGVNEVVVSWWGQGSWEDQRLALVEQVATAAGLSVAIHIEPYRGRAPAGVAADIAYLRSTYGTTQYFVYRAQDFTASQWAAALDGLAGVTVWAESFWDHLENGKVQSFAAAAGFQGVYTYDPFDITGPSFAAICGAARMQHLLCSPSVAPGFSAQRATGGSAVRSRQSGLTYDSMWRGALASRPDLVSITSYNEWHEGTQIEPARPMCPDGACYKSFEGAYGWTGAAADGAYLWRTAEWSAGYRAWAAP